MSTQNDIKSLIYYVLLQFKSFPGALANKALAVVEALEGKVSIFNSEAILIVKVHYIGLPHFSIHNYSWLAGNIFLKHETYYSVLLLNGLTNI